MMCEPYDWSFLVLAFFVGASLFTFVCGVVLYKLAEVGVFP